MNIRVGIFIILLIYGCAGSSLLHELFSGYSKLGLLSSCNMRASHYRGFSSCRALAVTAWASVVVAHGLRAQAGSIVMAHGLSCSTVCGIFRDQESNLCLLHWQMDSLLLSHQGRPQSKDFSLDVLSNRKAIKF